MGAPATPPPMLPPKVPVPPELAFEGGTVGVRGGEEGSIEGGSLGTHDFIIVAIKEIYPISRIGLRRTD